MNILCDHLIDKTFKDIKIISHLQQGETDKLYTNDHHNINRYSFFFERKHGTNINLF